MQLEDVALDLELGARHVVEDATKAVEHDLGPAHGEVDIGQPERRVLGTQPVDVVAEPSIR